jgi:thiamine biosynthesis lipoprotein ApbE
MSGSGLTRDVTVSVVAPQGILADGLSTAVSVLGMERGLELAARHPGVSAAVGEGTSVRLLRLH